VVRVLGVVGSMVIGSIRGVVVGGGDYSGRWDGDSGAGRGSGGGRGCGKEGGLSPGTALQRWQTWVAW